MPDVSVPQQSGEIQLQTNGDAPVVLPVTKGRVSVEEPVVSVLLSSIPGSQVVPAKS